MVTQERFRQGMTFQQYLDQMGTNKDQFTKFLSEIQVPPKDKAALAKLGKKLKVVVITEDWCGDSLYDVPVLAKSRNATDPHARSGAAAETPGDEPSFPLAC